MHTLVVVDLWIALAEHMTPDTIEALHSFWETTLVVIVDLGLAT